MLVTGRGGEHISDHTSVHLSVYHNNHPEDVDLSPRVSGFVVLGWVLGIGILESNQVMLPAHSHS